MRRLEARGEMLGGHYADERSVDHLKELRAVNSNDAVILSGPCVVTGQQCLAVCLFSRLVVEWT